MAKLLNISKISNNSTDIILFRSCFRIFYVVRELGYPHRQLRGFRREEHTAAHVLCLFEPVGRVAQNMSKKAWATNRKRSMSVGISGDSRLYKQSSQEIPLPSPIPYVKILTNSISDENGIILIMHPFHFVQHAADRNGGA